MQVLVFIGYVALGIVQWIAIIDGLTYWTGMSTFFAGVISFFIANIPLVGSILGFVGAVEVWGWAWWQAGLLFFGGFALVVALGGMGAVTAFFDRRKQRA